MSRLPIRARLTLVFLLVMAAVLGIIGSFLYFRTKHNLDESIAQSLRARQGAARAYAERESRGTPVIPPGERFAQVLTESGEVLVSRPGGATPLLNADQARAAAGGARFFELHERERYLAGPGRVNGRPVVVVVGASLSDREKALEGLGGALLVGGPLALLLAAGIAYALAAGALRPVEEMGRKATTLLRADPSVLLPVPEVDDELKRLSLRLNEMLSRMGEAAQHERRFIANASHELRTPLAALQAELEIAERHATSADQLRDAISRGRKDIARLIGLSNGLLDLAVAEQTHTEPLGALGVDVLLEAIAADLRHRLPEHGRALIVRPSGLAAICEPSSLRRALSNLAENAIVHGQGDVTLGARRAPDGENVELWVHDQGSLSPSLHEGEAFEHFVRGADSFEKPGAGLGLALVKAVARAHGGTAKLIDDPDGGVQASISIPVNMDP